MGKPKQEGAKDELNIGLFGGDYEIHPEYVCVYCYHRREWMILNRGQIIGLRILKPRDAGFDSLQTLLVLEISQGQYFREPVLVDVETARGIATKT